MLIKKKKFLINDLKGYSLKSIKNNKNDKKGQNDKNDKNDKNIVDFVVFVILSLFVDLNRGLDLNFSKIMACKKID